MRSGASNSISSRLKEVRETASKLNKVSGIPVNLTKLIDYLKVFAMSIAMPESISGYCMKNNFSKLLSIKDNVEYIVVVNKNMHYYRRRFTIAHELWHVCEGSEGIVFSRDMPPETLKPLEASKTHKISKIPEISEAASMVFPMASAMAFNANAIHDRLADIFATELLMPEDAVREMYENGIRDIKAYCGILRVSHSAMMIRLFDELGYNKEEFLYSAPRSRSL